jgi:hypothetical protein
MCSTQSLPPNAWLFFVAAVAAVQATDFTAEAIRTVLAFIYTDKLSLARVQDDLLKELLLLADLWLLPPAVERCQHRVLSGIGVDHGTALRWLLWADDHSTTDCGRDLREVLVEWVAKQWALVCLNTDEDLIGMFFQRPALAQQAMCRIPCAHNLKFVDVQGDLKEVEDVIPCSPVHADSEEGGGALDVGNE